MSSPTREAIVNEIGKHRVSAILRTDNEETAARAMAAADFGNGVSWELDRRDGYSFINPDLTVYLNRMPTSDSVCIQSRSRYQSNGVGFAESLVWDQQGPIGRSIQSLLVDQRSE